MPDSVVRVRTPNADCTGIPGLHLLRSMPMPRPNRLLLLCLLPIPVLVFAGSWGSASAQDSAPNPFRLSARSRIAESLNEPDPASHLKVPSPRNEADGKVPAEAFELIPQSEMPSWRENSGAWDPLLHDESLHQPIATDMSANSPAAFPDFQPHSPPSIDVCETPFIRYRDTCYQGSHVTYGVIPAGSSNLGIESLDLMGVFSIPLDGIDNVVSFVPFFRLDDLNAPVPIDLPDSLYEAGVKTFWRRNVNEDLTTTVLFTPSVRSDFDSSQQAFKLFGTAMLTWKIVPDQISVFGGVMYTGREDFPVLPTMGVYWTPSPVWKFDIQFPSPRISRRIYKDNDFSETWTYVSGVFGGNTWAVKRASGQNDQLTLRDLRLMVGIEHLRKNNRGVFLETGWVFSRSMEYENTPGQIDFGDALMLRAGIQF